MVFKNGHKGSQRMSDITPPVGVTEHPKRKQWRVTAFLVNRGSVLRAVGYGPRTGRTREEAFEIAKAVRLELEAKRREVLGLTESSSSSPELGWDVWRPLRPSVHAKRNLWRFTDDTKQVIEMQLTQGFRTIFDAADLALVSQCTWHSSVFPKVGVYATTDTNSDPRTGVFKASLHRLIVGDAKMVDHINGDTCDNRRANLRPADARINSNNRRLRQDNTTGANGVVHRVETKAYRVRWQLDGKRHSVSFSYRPTSGRTQEEAFALAVAKRRAVDEASGCTNGQRPKRQRNE